MTLVAGWWRRGLRAFRPRRGPATGSASSKLMEMSRNSGRGPKLLDSERQVSSTLMGRVERRQPAGGGL